MLTNPPTYGTLLYPTSGTSIDFYADVTSTGFGFCSEMTKEGSGYGGFDYPEDMIPQVGAETLAWMEVFFDAAASASPDPTKAPTVTPQPTPECVCDQKLVVEIETDAYPEETSWELVTNTGGPGCVDSQKSGQLTKAHKNKKYVKTVATKICGFLEYTFSMWDSYGDGICCASGSGSWKLELDGAVTVGQVGPASPLPTHCHRSLMPLRTHRCFSFFAGRLRRAEQLQIWCALRRSCRQPDEPTPLHVC